MDKDAYTAALAAAAAAGDHIVRVATEPCALRYKTLTPSL
jgi:hypothetical protein